MNFTKWHPVEQMTRKESTKAFKRIRKILRNGKKDFKPSSARRIYL